MKELDHDSFDEVMGALGEQLAILQAKPVVLIICGGAALGALGLVLRTTKDVDVLALVEENAIVKADPFPAALKSAANRVAADFHLPVNWINSGPTDLVDGGLPEGMEKRWSTRSYGSALIIHCIGRMDQIHLKLYASVDRGPQDRHYADLRALHPTSSEIRIAAQWTRQQDDSETFLNSLRDCVRDLGYDDVADGL